MHDFIIIGAGIHGCHAFFSLTNHGFRCLLIDPQPPLTAWKRYTERCEMSHLRSSKIVHLDPDISSLARFSKGTSYRNPGQRPLLSTFNNHSDHLVRKYALAKHHQLESCQSIEKTKDGWKVETDKQTHKSRYVLLTLGNGKLNIPVLHDSIRTTHLFDSGLSGCGERPLLVGSGISAFNAALWLTENTDRNPTIWSRHPIKYSYLDGEADYTQFSKFRSMEGLYTHKVLDRLSRHGTVPPDIAEQVQKTGRVKIEIVKKPPKSFFEFFDHLICCTGFVNECPVLPVIRGVSLKRSDRQFPILNRHCEWVEGLFCSGLLAQLTVGPFSRNIIGANIAVRAILARVLDDVTKKTRLAVKR